MPLSRRRGRSAPDPLTRIGRAMMTMRRTLIKPPDQCMPMPHLGRSVDLAKVNACLAIADATPSPAEGSATASVKDVAAALQLEHSTASRLLGEAEAEGLVVRGTDPNDRRRTTVALTAAGHEVVRDSTEIRTWAMGQVFADWSERDLRTLATLLERMATDLSDRMPGVLDAARHHFSTEDVAG